VLHAETVDTKSTIALLLQRWPAMAYLCDGLTISLLKRDLRRSQRNVVLSLPYSDNVILRVCLRVNKFRWGSLVVRPSALFRCSRMVRGEGSRRLVLGLNGSSPKLWFAIPDGRYRRCSICMPHATNNPICVFSRGRSLVETAAPSCILEWMLISD
jgi:hypothetical protein